MKAYPDYKASGIDWLGEIPSHWRIVPGKWSVKFTYGFPADSKLFSIEKKGLPLIRIRDINSDDTEVHYEGIDYPEESIIHTGDILIGMDGDFNIAKWKGKDAILNQRVCKYSDSEVIIKDYVFYLMPLILNDINSTKYATTVKHLSAVDLSEMRLPIPPFAEQEAIAMYLDNKTAMIDTLVAEKQAQVDDLRKYRTSLITETVTHGLNPKAALRPSGINWIGNVPEHWECLKMKYCIEISNGSDPKTEGNVPVYGSGASSFKTCGEYKFGPTVLIGRKGATLHIPHWIEGKYWNVDTAFDTHAKEGYDLKYFYYVAIIFDYGHYKSETTLPSMTQTAYENAYIPVPPLSEQQQIAEYLDEKTAKIDALIDELTQQLDELALYRKAVISEAVTGKVDVRDWKPED